MNSITIDAHAKINLHLSILAKRNNGYHDVQMIMVPLALCDHIKVSESALDAPISISCSDSLIPLDERNLCWKAAALLSEVSGVSRPVLIEVEKHIPSGAGLAGGSSDAVAVLRGLNELWGLEWSDMQLAEIAIKIGADCPFFCSNAPAVAEGIGEKLTLFSSFPKLWVILVNPGFEVSTPWAYKQWDLKLTPQSPHARFPRHFKDIQEVVKILHNDLENVVSEEYNDINQMKEMLVEVGAVASMMTGSGPTIFGLFESRKTRDYACRRLSGEDWNVIATEN